MIVEVVVHVGKSHLTAGLLQEILLRSLLRQAPDFVCQDMSL